MDAKRIVAELSRGNNQPLQYLYEAYGTYCIKNLRRNTGCTLEDAQDVLADALMAFREQVLAGKTAHVLHLRNYLYTICLHKQRDRYRQQQKQEARKQEVMHTLYGQTSEKPQLEQEAELAAQQAKTQSVLAAFGQLKENCQKILLLFYVEKQSMKKIAKALRFANAGVAKTAKLRCYRHWLQQIKSQQHTPQEDDSDDWRRCLGC